MVKVGVGDDDMADGLTPSNSVQNGRKMVRVVWPGVDNRKLGRADQPGIGSGSCQGGWIWREQPPDGRITGHRALPLSKWAQAG